MKLKHTLLAGALLSALAISAALAQTGTFILNLGGSEVFKGAVGSSPGGTGFFTPTYVLRSGANHQLVATGTTVNTQVLAQNENVLATGAITTWNVTLPANPYSGQRVTINCPGGTITTLAIAANAAPSGVSLVGTNPTSCTSGGAITNGSSWQYSTSAKTWYRYL